MPNGGKLLFRTLRENNHLHIKIEDTGGIDETVKAKIFDPFFSMKDEGFGLGLSVVYKIVNQHKGQIRAIDSTDGTIFALIFPIKVSD